MQHTMQTFYTRHARHNAANTDGSRHGGSARSAASLVRWRDAYPTAKRNGPVRRRALRACCDHATLAGKSPLTDGSGGRKERAPEAHEMTLRKLHGTAQAWPAALVGL